MLHMQLAQQRRDSPYSYAINCLGRAWIAIECSDSVIPVERPARGTSISASTDRGNITPLDNSELTCERINIIDHQHFGKLIRSWIRWQCSDPKTARKEIQALRRL